MMPPKERWIAAARMEPVDRLPFWPKLDAAYPRAQEGPFGDMSINELHEWIGSDVHAGCGSALREVRTNTSSRVESKDGHRRHVYEVPGRELQMVTQFDPDSQSWHPIEHGAKSREDILALTQWYEDCSVEIDYDALERVRANVANIGQSAVVATGIGTSAMMHWVEWLAGVEHAHWFLADYPDEVRALFEAIHRNLLRRAELVCETTPADFVYMIENTSTTLISPAQYTEFCQPHLLAYAQIADAAGRMMILHMCGHLKALLPQLGSLPVRGFEAFTSPTLGNTTLLDGRTDCPDKLLIGGTNAMLWTRSAKEIIAQIERDLDVLPHHRGIAVTSAGVMTPLCRPETIREVCEWVKGYGVKN